MKPYRQDQSDHRQPDFCQVAAAEGRRLLRTYFHHSEETATREDGTEQTVYTADFIERLSDAQNAVELAREEVTGRIDEHDTSEAVNSFTLQGKQMWLSRDLRTTLARRLETEEAEGRTDTVLWYGTESYAMPIETAKQMLQQIESYAIRCYDQTLTHKAAVAALETVEEIAAYDYESGYPDRLDFE